MHDVPKLPLLRQVAGETVELHGERAMYWPARRRLVIADLHLGKEHVFRQAGIPVPVGATIADLNRLTTLLRNTDANSLWIVGDVLHGPASGDDWIDVWRHWRKAHAQIDIVALTGNHDRALHTNILDVEQGGDALVDGPFLFCHVPHTDVSGRYVIAGHIHPQMRLPGVPRNWPVFWIRPDRMVLPAFSLFTGGHPVLVKRDDQVVACVDGEAMAIY